MNRSGRRWTTAAAILGAAGIAALLGAGYLNRRFGALPDGAEYSGVSNWKDGRFQNREPVVIHPGKIVRKTGFFRFIFYSPNRPEEALPRLRLTRKDFPPQKDDFSVRWMGHSFLIFEWNRLRFATDPVFGNAAPVPGVLRRYAPPPLPSVGELEGLDFLLISHDHYDHLEYETLRALRNSPVRIITAKGVGARLVSWGIPAERITELAWGESTQAGGLRITAEEGRHFSGRTFSDRFKTLWCSFVIEGGGKKVFFGGDGGYGKHFKRIAGQYGPFDLVCLEIDAWNEQWPNHHLFPHEAVAAAGELGAKTFLPIHWGVFDLARHPWNQSIEAVAKEAKRSSVPLATPLMGEKFVPAGTAYGRRWW